MLPSGTLVSISGLQSEAGRALNGGRGLIIGKPADDTGRHPVLVYAVVGKDEAAGTRPQGMTSVPWPTLVLRIWNWRKGLAAIRRSAVQVTHAWNLRTASSD